MIRLTADESFVAAKRKTQEERKINSRRFAQSKHQLATFVFLARITTGVATTEFAETASESMFFRLAWHYFCVLCDFHDMAPFQEFCCEEIIEKRSIHQY